MRGLAKLAESRSGLLAELGEAAGVQVEVVEAALRRSERSAEMARLAAEVGVLMLDIPEGCWEKKDDDDPDSDLYCGILINGVLHHFGAMRVEVGEDGVQQAVGPYPEDLDAVTALYEPDHPFNTITVGDKDYLVHLVPGC
jgi:hypothetical protein